MIDFYTTKIIKRRKQICFSGFKYYHNPKHSGPYTAGRQGGAIAPLRKLYLRFLECH